MQFFTNAFADTTSEIEIGSETAQEATTSGVMSSLMSFVPLVVIFAIFYFLIIRPQQKKVKTHEKMISSIKRGDKISTVGGIIGVVTKIDNATLILTIEISNNVEMKILKSSVAEIMNRPKDDTKK